MFEILGFKLGCLIEWSDAGGTLFQFFFVLGFGWP